MDVALKANLDTHDANGAPRFSGHSARASGAFHLAPVQSGIVADPAVRAMVLTSVSEVYQGSTAGQSP